MSAWVLQFSLLVNFVINLHCVVDLAAQCDLVQLSQFRISPDPTVTYGQHRKFVADPTRLKARLPHLYLFRDNYLEVFDTVGNQVRLHQLAHHLGPKANRLQTFDGPALVLLGDSLHGVVHQNGITFVDHRGTPWYDTWYHKNPESTGFVELQPDDSINFKFNLYYPVEGSWSHNQVAVPVEPITEADLGWPVDPPFRATFFANLRRTRFIPNQPLFLVRTFA